MPEYLYQEERTSFCQRKALQQPYLAHSQTPPINALAALIGIPPLILPVFKVHLINKIGIRKTYADSHYRDRGPLSLAYLQKSSSSSCTNLAVPRMLKCGVPMTVTCSIQYAVATPCTAALK